MFLRRPLTDDDISVGRRATEEMRHRGPDAGGEWYDREAGIYLGHRRLTIIDLSDASNQPMALHDLVLTYNGEIYNYRALRERLTGLGHEFRTSGDTEVLLQAWQKFGRHSVDEFDGMFGFALWDGASGWLAVDRFAEKQIYVATVADGVMAASELPTLARAAGAIPKLSETGVTAFMALGYLPGPETAYPTIRRMPPAVTLKIDGGEVVEEFKYWHPPFGEPRRGRIKPIEKRDLDRIQQTLIESVERRLESDAPACLYLSSGTDSTLVAAIAAKELNRPLETLTVAYNRGDTHNEAHDAAIIAATLGLEHRIVENQDTRKAAGAEFLFQLLGQPCADLTLASLYQMAKAGSNAGYKVGLTGLGGDEVAFGYGKNIFFFKNRHILNAPEVLRRFVGLAIAPLTNHWGKIATFCNVVAVRDWERYLAVKNTIAMKVLRRLPGYASWASAFFASTSRQVEFDVPKFEFLGVMTDGRLPSSDAGSMRAGIEFRTPYLSPHVQAALAELDPRALLHFGQKHVLRSLLGRYLPQHLVDLPKRGFIFPADRFLDIYDSQPPRYSELDEHVMAEVWRHRYEQGWRDLAVRLCLLGEFERWSPEASTI